MDDHIPLFQPKGIRRLFEDNGGQDVLHSGWNVSRKGRNRNII